MNNRRDNFPLLSRKANDKPLVYFDNAATSPKPQSVIDAVVNYYKNHAGNPGRGTHTLSFEASQIVEQGRAAVLSFLNASSEKYTVVFTKNATEALNLAAHILKGKPAIATVSEHHSNFLPWKNKQLASILPTGEIDLNNLEQKVQENPNAVLAITHGSNVTGNITNLAAISELAQKYQLTTVVDAAQTVAHEEIDLTKTPVDFLAASAHKMFGPEGVGFLVMNKSFLNSEPLVIGGGAVDSVGESSVTLKNTAERFEAGTLHTAGIAGLIAAIEFIKSVGRQTIKQTETELLKYFMEKVPSIPEMKVVGTTKTTERTPLVAFTIGNIHPHDIADFLDSQGIAVRAGFHCAEPLHKALGIGPTVRASLSFFNEKQEIDLLFTAITQCIQKFA